MSYEIVNMENETKITKLKQLENSVGDCQEKLKGLKETLT